MLRISPLAAIKNLVSIGINMNAFVSIFPNKVLLIEQMIKEMRKKSPAKCLINFTMVCSKCF